MRTISPDLQTAFQNGNRATIVKITTKSGTIYGYTDWDHNLTVSSQLYIATPGLTRTQLTATVDDQVSNQEFAFGWINPPEADLLAGKLDNAEVEVAFCNPLDVTQGRFVFDKGNIGVIQWTADGVRADMQSHMRQLSRNLNFVYTASCRHKLFSQYDDTHIGACTLNSASYTYTGTVATVVTPKIKFTVSGLAQPAGQCTNGILTWTSGTNNGLAYEVKLHSTGPTTVELFLPTFATIGVGNTFTITAGCDKLYPTCKTKFSNGNNFGGFPHIQTEVQYR